MLSLMSEQLPQAPSGLADAGAMTASGHPLSDGHPPAGAPDSTQQSHESHKCPLCCQLHCLMWTLAVLQYMCQACVLNMIIQQWSHLGCRAPFRAVEVWTM
jgi:hypothetical protein